MATDNKVLQLPPDWRGQPQPLQQPNFEYEQALLGAILVRPEVFESILDAGVKPESFQGGHGLIFEAMLALNKEGAPVDLVAVCGRLREWGKLEKAGGPVFLAGLSEQVGFATNASYYAHKVRQEGWRREYRKIILELHSAEQTSGAADEELITLLSSKLVELENSYPGSFAQRSPILSLEELLSMKFPDKSELIGGGIWPAGTGFMIAGESGAGKSLLTNQLVVSLAMGWDFLGLEIPTARRVLVFEAENTLQQEQERYLSQIRGMKITTTPPNIAYFPIAERLELINPHHRKIMAAAIDSHKADVFFLDPLISFHSENENDNGAMRRVLDHITEIMRKTGAGAGVLHHFGKPTENGALEYRARGAMAIRDWCDTLLALTVKKAAQGGYLHNLTFVKVRNGRQPKPMTLERDENFVSHVTEEESRCTPEQVAAIIRAAGGRINGRKALVAAIQDVIECGARIAEHFITAAIEKRTIIAVPGDRAPGKKGIAPKAYIPCETGEDDEG